MTSHLDDGLAVITLDDGDTGNRLDRPTLVRLHRHLEERIEEPGSRVLLLRSRGERFCLGMDLDQIKPEAGAGGDEAAATVRLYSDCLTSIALSPKPVVVLVEGEVRGGGMGLVAAGDVTIASRAADFEFSEVLFGLIPANVIPFLLIQRLSPHTAGRLIMTAKRMTAEEAREVGLVDEIFSPEELEKGARGVIGRFFRASPGALAEAKRFLRDILYREMEDACARANRELLDLASRAEVRDAARAFLSGGLPEWSRRFRPSLPLCGKGAEESK